jgi:hypothetical protein
MSLILTGHRGAGCHGAVRTQKEQAVKSLIAQALESMGTAAVVPFEATFADGTRYRNRDESPRFSIHCIWLAYLIGCAEMFRSPVERTHLFQIVFSKGNINEVNYPMSRAFLYRERNGRD